MRHHAVVTAVLAFLALGLFARELRAASAVISPDITVELDGAAYADDEVVFDATTVWGTAPLGTFPEAADIEGYHLSCCSEQLYTLDTAVDLGGGIVAMPGDVVRVSGGIESIEFDASSEGIPDGTRVDAVSLDGSGNLLLSFDTAVDLGAGLVASDEDLVSFDGASFALFFDGSSEGIAEGLDLDGASYDPTGDLLLVSFDTSGTVGGLTFDDEDILEFDASGPAWTLAYEGEVEHATLAAADLNAVPEPGRVLLLAAGTLGLWTLSVHRARRRVASKCAPGDGALARSESRKR